MKQKIFLGFDISTTCIGISLFDEAGQLLKVEHLVLKPDKDVLPEHRIFAKANMFKSFIEKFKEYEVIKIFIEEPLVMSNNINTSNLLMKFNGICSYILLNDLLVIPDYISVYDIRVSLCPELIRTEIKKGVQKNILSFPKDIKGKEYVFTKIQTKYKEIEWLKDKKGTLSKYNYDMSDAIAVGLAGLSKFCY
jgi:hypothetical protein